MSTRRAAGLVLVLPLLLLARAVLAIQLEPVLDSVVRVSTHLTVRDSENNESIYVVQGSGWTSACKPEGEGYRVEVRTAAHVVDPAHTVELTGMEEPWTLVGVSYELEYGDGSRYRLPAQAYRRGSDDSAVLQFRSRVRRPGLPAGDPRKIRPGDRLYTVACPEGLRFLACDGLFSNTLGQAGLGPSLPPGWRESWWLSTLPVAPGSSGAPVLDENGQVVGQVVGRLEWPGGSFSILQPGEVKP
ncbi:MAG: trypsin-like peptidase domain-containing protein [Armatimonadetes bacterium]|nr:trypsin-like peptidase domain-containing protein [Armatimonadota bacterium]